MKRVLITGASGFIGKNVIDYFEEKKDFVLLALADEKDLIGIEYLKSKGVDIIFVRDFQTYNERIDYCIHLASYGVAYGSRDINMMIDVNVKLSAQILDFCSKRECQLFINTGSCFEYGLQPKNEPLTETNPLNPEDIYAASKVSCETFLNVYSKVLGIKFITVRPFSVFGKYENSQRLFPLILNSGINKIPLELTGCEQIRDYMFVSDVADAFYRLIINSDSLHNHESINICSGLGLSLKEIISYIVDTLSFDKGLFIFGAKPYRKNESMYFVGNNKRLKEIIGNVDYSINQQKILDFYNWYLKNK